MVKQKASPAMRFLWLTWDSQGYQRGHSWERLNHAMREALSLAIVYGFRFDLGDFKKMVSAPSDDGFSFGFWAGRDGESSGESFYSLAVHGHQRYGPNRSAAMAFEHWKRRRPFLIRVAPTNKAPERVAVGTEFLWYGERVKVTSFSADGQHLTACSYTDHEYTLCPECTRVTCTTEPKVLRRFRITHGDIREYHKNIKRTRDLHAAWPDLSDAQRDQLHDLICTFRGTERLPPDTVLKAHELDAVESRLREIASVTK